MEGPFWLSEMLFSNTLVISCDHSVISVMFKSLIFYQYIYIYIYILFRETHT